MAKAFNVDPGVKPAPNLMPSGGGGGSNVSTRDTSDLFKNVGKLFDTVEKGYVEGRARSAEAELTAYRDRTTDSLLGLPTVEVVNQPTTENGATQEKPKEVSVMEERLARAREAYQQGKLPKSMLVGLYSAGVRDIRTRYSDIDQYIPDISKRVFGYDVNKTYADAVFKEGEEAEKTLKEEEKRWIGDKDTASKLGIGAEILAQGDTNPEARKQIRAKIYDRQASEATFKKRKEQLELKKAEDQTTKDDAFETASQEIDTQFGHLFGDAFEGATGKIGFSGIMDAIKQAKADGVVSPEEAAQIKAQFAEFKTKIGMKVQDTLNRPFGDDKKSYATRIGDKSKLDQIQARVNDRLALLEDNMLNKEYGLLAWNKSMIDAIGEGDQLNLLRSDTIFRELKAINAAGGQAAVDKFLSDPKNQSRLMSATKNPAVAFKELGNIAIGVVGGKPLDQVIKDTPLPNGQDKSAVTTSAISSSVNRLLDKTTTPEIAGKISESLFSDGNINFLQNFNQKDKKKVFDQLTSPAVTDRIMALAKDNPQILQNYKKWAELNANNMMREHMMTLNNHVSDGKGLFNFGDGANKEYPIGFDGQNFHITRDKTATGLREGGLSGMARSISAEQSETAINEINSFLKTMRPIYEAMGLPPNQMLDTLFEGMGVNTEVKTALTAAFTAYKGADPNAKAPTELPEEQANKGAEPSALVPTTFVPKAQGQQLAPIEDRIKEYTRDAEVLEKRGDTVNAKFYRDRVAFMQANGYDEVLEKPANEGQRVKKDTNPVTKVLYSGEGKKEADRQQDARVQEKGQKYFSKPEDIEAIKKLQPVERYNLLMRTVKEQEFANKTDSPEYYKRNAEARRAYDSIDITKLPANTKGLLTAISKPESGGDYNKVYGEGRKNLTGMTVGQVLSMQKQQRSSGAASTASGRYQFIYTTLNGLVNELGLDENTPFNEETQDKLALRLLQRRGYDKYLSGAIDEDTFIRNLSQEWAGLPNTNGRSYYDGDGLNKSGINIEKWRTYVRKLKEGKN